MKKVVIFSGAGISAESGISTFRDSNGLWENYSIEEICNINTWKKNRKKVFEFYNQRRLQLETVKPNLIHETLAELEKEKNIEVINLTQNVDDLLERAGCKNVIHLHGELTKMMCTSCKIQDPNTGFKEHPNWEIGYKEANEETIRCPHCNSNQGVKPFVVFFGEIAPNYLVLKSVFRNIKQGDIVIVLGTMGTVININSYINFLESDVWKVLNNLEKNEFINDKLFDLVLYKPGTEAIKEIKNFILNRI